jgi:hypothetical protein
MASHPNHTTSSVPDLIPTEFVAMGKKHFDECAKVQTEFLGRLRDANQKWINHVQAEIRSFSDFGAKLIAARSIPEAATAYQDLATRHMEMANECAKHFLAESRAFMETGSRILSKGQFPDGRNAST